MRQFISFSLMFLAGISSLSTSVLAMDDNDNNSANAAHSAPSQTSTALAPSVPQEKILPRLFYATLMAKQYPGDYLCRRDNSLPKLLRQVNKELRSLAFDFLIFHPETLEDARRISLDVQHLVLDTGAFLRDPSYASLQTLDIQGWNAAPGTDHENASIATFASATLYKLSLTNVMTANTTMVQAVLNHCPRIQKLGLAYTMVTDDVIQALENATQLKYVDLRGTQLTAQAIELLKKKRHDLIVRFGDN